MTTPTADTDPSSPSTDNSALQAWVRALEKTSGLAREPYVTFPVVIERLAQTHGDAPALCDERTVLSYRALAERANRYSRWALSQQMKTGDVVCLLMTNSTEYMPAWLGITRIGGIVALLNTHLPGERLAHCINVVQPDHILTSGDLHETLASALPYVQGGARRWVFGLRASGFESIDEHLTSLAPSAPAPHEYRIPSLSDRALFIYTSGTTGLPKAAHVSHHRVMQWSHWFAGMMDTRPQDRMFNCLPMYHSIGGVVATGATLVGGGTVYLRKRFSASDFWRDVVSSGCTLFQYIGELCRYLVNTPPDPIETQHKLRLCCGNGLRPDVWSEFQDRFRVPRILEYYASTEGNFSLYNCEGKPGAIGRIPPFLSHRLPVALIRSDPDTLEPLRSEQGTCLRCAPEEIGEAIGRIPDRPIQVGQFEGYTDENASRRKILRNVFAAGDAWYRTGDLMRKDQQGFFYFVDRIGDTFRWKGENVSTTEVAEALARAPGVLEAVVYGVSIPGAEGRAGMAALIVREGFDLERLYAHCEAHLPEYARPLFLRILAALETTATFKPKKQDLARAGFDPAKAPDPLYFRDRRSGRFIELRKEVFSQLQAGGLGL